MKEAILNNGDCVYNGNEDIKPVIVGHMYGYYEIIGTTKKKRGVVRSTQKFVVIKNSKTERVIAVAPKQLTKLSKLAFSNADTRKRSFRSNCAFSELQAVEIYQEMLENKTLPLELRKTIAELAAKYNVSSTTLHNLLNGKTYPIIKLIIDKKVKLDDVVREKRETSINQKITTSVTILTSMKKAVIFALQQIDKDTLLIDKVKNIKEFDSSKSNIKLTRYNILNYNKEQINNVLNVLISAVNNMKD